MQHILCVGFGNWLDVYHYNPNPKEYCLDEVYFQKMSKSFKDSVLILYHMALSDVTIKADLEKIDYIRSVTDIPIVVFCYGTQQEKVCKIFEHGVVDYITPKTNPEEVKMRLYSHINRYLHTVLKDQFYELQYNNLILNKREHTIKVEGNIVPATKIEFNLLEMLMENIGTMLKDEDLFEAIWERDLFEQEDTNRNCLAVHISKIRRKLYTAGMKKSIRRIMNTGYIMDKLETVY